MAGHAGIVLAAGASRRMGARGPKALLCTPGGATFLEVVVQRCLEVGCSPVVVVTGAHPLVPPAGAIAALNPEWSLGQLRSLQVGLGQIGDALDGVLLALVDHPLVRPQTYSALVEAWERTRAPLVRPVFEGRHGHPVIFGASLFPELCATPLEQGARPVVLRHRARSVDVVVPDPGILADLDTPEDLERL